jgi:hypothetical protein
MKAITLHQPWATLMAIGAKRIETRSWETLYRGPLAIHASKTMKKYAKDACFDLRVLKAFGWRDIDEFPSTLEFVRHIEEGIAALPRGVVVATVELYACERIGRFYDGPDPVGCPFSETEYACGNYEPGRFAWVTRDVRRLENPVAALGALGLWDWEMPA